MKKLAAILVFAAWTSFAFAQGFISFVNNNTWLVSAGGVPLPGGQPATFWFTILTGEPNTTDVFTFLPTGAYATNQNSAGRVFGGTGIPVQNWPAGVDRAFVVAGWSVNLGTTWNPGWLTGDFGSAATGFFGLSPIAPSAPANSEHPVGGVPVNVWGGTYGLTSGFNLEPIPEPTMLALAALGTAALLIFRHRERGLGNTQSRSMEGLFGCKRVRPADKHAEQHATEDHRRPGRGGKFIAFGFCWPCPWLGGTGASIVD